MSITEGVILAAGFSKRARKFKPAMLLGTKTLLEWCVTGMAPYCDRIIVVGGYRYEKIQSMVAPLAKVETVYNVDFRGGMFTSVKCGLRAVKANRVFMIPGDQPLVKRHTYQIMLKTNADIVIPKYKGKKGHPVLFRSYLITEILAMPDEGILRNFIHKKEAAFVEVDDRGILLDLDNPDDYEHIKQYYEQNFCQDNHQGTKTPRNVG